MAEISTNKRRRKEGLQLSDLPDNAVAHVAIYLSNISRALFAISSPSASKTTILSSDTKLWETLDFGDIDKSLAIKLTDDNIRDILTVVNAVNNTKSIKLMGCISIDGSGLSPLRGSVVLKQLDLSLVGQHEHPELYPEPSISDAAVVPILTSIINAEGNSLVYLQLPKKWRNNNRRRTPLTDFLETYNNHLASLQSKCTNCHSFIISPSCGHVHHRVNSNYQEFYGLQNNFCYICLKSYCVKCETEDDDDRNWLEYCHHCEKDFCAGCSLIGRCDGCRKTFCNYHVKTCDGLTLLCHDCEQR